MITLIQYIPNTGSLVELNAPDGSGNHIYPLSAFEMESAISTREFKKMTAQGEWPAFHYLGAMTIHAEGRILGSGATPSNDYVTKRIALIDAILPPTTSPLTARKHGVLRLRLDGMSENADADVVVTSFQAPLAALFPANSEFMVTWKAFLPWFVGVGTSTKYQLG